MTATGNVTVNAPIAFAGGLAGINGGSISNSNATGTVTTTASTFQTAGGLVGFNVLGTIERSFATGAVTVGDNGFAGGLVGINFGIHRRHAGHDLPVVRARTRSPAATTVFVAGLVRINLGTLDQTYAAGLVTGGPNSTTGGLVAINACSFDPG